MARRSGLGAAGGCALWPAPRALLRPRLRPRTRSSKSRITIGWSQFYCGNTWQETLVSRGRAAMAAEEKAGTVSSFTYDCAGESISTQEAQFRDQILEHPAS